MSRQSEVRAMAEALGYSTYEAYGRCNIVLTKSKSNAIVKTLFTSDYTSCYVFLLGMVEARKALRKAYKRMVVGKWYFMHEVSYEALEAYNNVFLYARTTLPIDNACLVKYTRKALPAYKRTRKSAPKEVK